jgi:hypothetical protein
MGGWFCSLYITDWVFLVPGILLASFYCCDIPFTLNPSIPDPAAPQSSPSKTFSGRFLTPTMLEITSSSPVLIFVPLVVLARCVHLHGAVQKE